MATLPSPATLKGDPQDSLESRPNETSLTQLEVKEEHDHANEEPIYFSGVRFYLLWTSYDAFYLASSSLVCL
jgi:hypothetical protein